METVITGGLGVLLGSLVTYRVVTLRQASYGRPTIGSGGSASAKPRKAGREAVDDSARGVMLMWRRVVLIVSLVAIFMAAGLFVFRYRDTVVSRLTADGRRQRILRRLNLVDVLVERNCGRGDASVSGERWQTLRSRDQDRAVAALASLCFEQTGVKTFTVRDADTGEVVAVWNGTAVERSTR